MLCARQRLFRAVKAKWHTSLNLLSKGSSYLLMVSMGLTGTHSVEQTYRAIDNRGSNSNIPVRWCPSGKYDLARKTGLTPHIPSTLTIYFWTTDVGNFCLLIVSSCVVSSWLTTRDALILASSTFRVAISYRQDGTCHLWSSQMLYKISSLSPIVQRRKTRLKSRKLPESHNQPVTDEARMQGGHHVCGFLQESRDMSHSVNHTEKSTCSHRISRCSVSRWLQGDGKQGRRRKSDPGQSMVSTPPGVQQVLGKHSPSRTAGPKCWQSQRHKM